MGNMSSEATVLPLSLIKVRAFKISRGHVGFNECRAIPPCWAENEDTKTNFLKQQSYGKKYLKYKDHSGLVKKTSAC